MPPGIPLPDGAVPLEDEREDDGEEVAPEAGRREAVALEPIEEEEAEEGRAAGGGGGGAAASASITVMTAATG